MPITIKNENWDSYTAGSAPPSPWVTSGGIVVSTSHPQSSPNSLTDPSGAGNTTYWPTDDGFGGKQTVSTKFYVGTGFGIIQILGRITSAPLVTCYVLKFGIDTYPLALDVRVASTPTTLLTIGSGGSGNTFSTGETYWMELQSGTIASIDNIKCRIQRLSDLNWLNASATWVTDGGTVAFGDGSGTTYCIDLTDSTTGRPSAAGYAGIRFNSNGGTGEEMWADDFSFKSLAFSSSSSSSRPSSSSRASATGGGGAGVFRSGIIQGMY